MCRHDLTKKAVEIPKDVKEGEDNFDRLYGQAERIR